MTSDRDNPILGHEDLRANVRPCFVRLIRLEERGARSGKEAVAAPELGAEGDARLAGASALSEREKGALGRPGREKKRLEAAQPGAGVGLLLHRPGRAAELRAGG